MKGIYEGQIGLANLLVWDDGESNEYYWNFFIEVIIIEIFVEILHEI